MIINKLKKYFRNPFFIKTQSVSEVTEFLKDAVDQKIIDKEAESIASKAIRLGDITVKEIMIPKVDMVTIQVKDDTNEIIKRIINDLAFEEKKKITFQEFNRKISKEIFGIVLTAHPTFGMTYNMMLELAKLATSKNNNKKLMKYLCNYFK